MSDTPKVRDRGESNAAGFLVMLFFLPVFWAFASWLINNLGTAAPDASVPTEVSVTNESAGDDPATTVVVETTASVGTDIAGSSTSSTTSTSSTASVATLPTASTVSPTASPASSPTSDAQPVLVYAGAPTWDRPFPTPQNGDYADAYIRLENMVIAPASSPLGYTREDWMNGWYPIDGVAAASPARISGCDVRQMLFLIWAQPGSAQRDNTCRATAGVYVDGYLGGQYTIPADRAVSKVDAEHVVALHEAHLSGGATWTEVQKNTFATDYTVRSYQAGGTQLALTLNVENQNVKSDHDLAAYLPADPATRCGFVVNVIAIKARYGLSMDAEEVSATLDYLETCVAGGTPNRP